MTEAEHQLVWRAANEWQQIKEHRLVAGTQQSKARSAAKMWRSRGTNPMRDRGEWATRYADKLLAILTGDEG